MILLFKQKYKNIKIENKDVWTLFNKIANKYNSLNHILSCAQDFSWRKRAISLVKNKKIEYSLDLATGTGDFIKTLLNNNKTIKKIVGLDMAVRMLFLAKKALSKHKESILFKGNACELYFKKKQFDMVTISFGIRNVESLNLCLTEIYRVLKKKGYLIILEFSIPRYNFFSELYFLYFRYILPKLGNILSGDSSAYKYLNESVEHFYEGKVFCDVIRQNKFVEVERIILNLGIVSIYFGRKK